MPPKATLEKTRLDPAKIDDICVGKNIYFILCEAFFRINFPAVCHPPSPLYISRAAALAAGIPYSVPISTVNRLCSSGLMAIRSIAHAIQAGEISFGWAVGAESMSLKYVFVMLKRIETYI